MPTRLCAVSVLAAAVLCLTAGCGPETPSGAPNSDPAGAVTPRGAVTAFWDALEHRDRAEMRRLMTPMAQRNESIEGGLLRDLPDLTSYRILHVEPEDPSSNGSPSGSIRSLRYTVELSPADGFSNDDTSGSAYGVLVAEAADKRWSVAELGGGG